MVMEWLSALVQNFIWEISVNVKKNFIINRKYKKFFKEIDTGIQEFCKNNECIYLNSSAFQYFIEHHNFVKKIIASATTTEISKSDNEFLQDNIKIAKSIAEREELEFGYNEEQIIKDLFKLINEKTSKFLLRMLSIEQRTIITKTLNSIVGLKEIVNDFRNDTKARFDLLDDTLKNITKISGSNEILLAELIVKNIWENDLDTVEKIRHLIGEKSESLEVFLKVIFCSFAGKFDKIVEQLSQITNELVRDMAVKTILPILIYNNYELNGFENVVTSKILSEILSALRSKDYTPIFSEKIINDNGIEAHSFEINKKMVCEEEWLVQQIIFLHLYKQQISNIFIGMEKIVGENANWLNKLLIADKYIQFISYGKPDNIDTGKIKTIKYELEKLKNNISNYGEKIQVAYYGVVLKLNFIFMEDEKIEDEIPEKIKNCSPIRSYLFMTKIKRHECSVDEVYLFARNNNEYWLLNNYFLEEENHNIVVDFCEKHEECFEKNPVLFIMFIRSLKSLGDDKERIKYLMKYKSQFSDIFEFWNEYLEMDSSDIAKNEFINNCQTWHINCLFSRSEELIIERLLQFQKYDIALHYIHRLEVKGGNIYKIKKYKGIIEQSNGNQIEALVLFKEAFEDNKQDEYVLDCIISISLMNNRRITDEYISAAEKIGSSRLLMLAAAAYKNGGDDVKARIANKKSILLSKEEFNASYSQYLLWHSSNKHEYVQKITGFNEDTCAQCLDDMGKRFYICIESDLVLPESPYEWHGDIHMYKDDAAEAGLLRKHTGDIIYYNDKQCKIEKIIPIDAYYFDICSNKMRTAGAAKIFHIPERDGILDINAFKEWLINNTSDEKSGFDWVKQYNNIEEIPLSLYMYKRFSRASYLQFVDLIFESKDIFIREYKNDMKPKISKRKYIFSFSAAAMLYKIGFPVEKIIQNNGFITSSCYMQVNSDVTSIIEEYDRENVASIGVYDGQLFLNQTAENGKEYWIKEAGKIKKYFNAIPKLENAVDLSEESLVKINLKELVGICDYDALAIVKSNNEYVLVTIEALLNILAVNEALNVECIRVIEWLGGINLPCRDLLLYAKSLLKYGCLYTMNKDIIQIISKKLEKMNDVEKDDAYYLLDETIKSLDLLEGKMKMVAIQFLSGEMKSLMDKNITLDDQLINIIVRDVLLLKRQKLEIGIDNSGHLISHLRDMTVDEKNVATLELQENRK